MKNVGIGTLALALAAFVASVWSVTAQGSPVIARVAGHWAHKATVIVEGSGFGSKSTPRPAVWDDASGTSNIVSKWDGAWPDCSGNSDFNLDYRTPAQI